MTRDEKLELIAALKGCEKFFDMLSESSGGVLYMHPDVVKSTIFFSKLTAHFQHILKAELKN